MNKDVLRNKVEEALSEIRPFLESDGGDIELLSINNNIVEDLTKMNLSELFVMEQFETRSKLTKIFNSLDTIVNLEFAKKIVNERFPISRPKALQSITFDCCYEAYIKILTTTTITNSKVIRSSFVLS